MKAWGLLSMGVLLSIRAFAVDGHYSKLFYAVAKTVEGAKNLAEVRQLAKAACAEVRSDSTVSSIDRLLAWDEAGCKAVLRESCSKPRWKLVRVNLRAQVSEQCGIGEKDK